MRGSGMLLARYVSHGTRKVSLTAPGKFRYSSNCRQRGDIAYIALSIYHGGGDVNPNVVTRALSPLLCDSSISLGLQEGSGSAQAALRMAGFACIDG